MFQPFPTLNTNRLILRKIEETDVEKVYDLRRNEIINKYIQRDIPNQIDDVNKFIKMIHELVQKNKGIFWIISLKKQPHIAIGTIGLRHFNKGVTYAEIGYELHPNFHKQGIMSEAFEKVLSYGFDQLNLENIEAFTHQNNANSIKLLKKYHFVFDSAKKDKGFPNNQIFRLEKKIYIRKLT